MTSLNWKRTIEQIALRNRSYRILGFTSVATGAGVSLVCRLTAKALTDCGCRVLLVDLSEAAPADTVTPPPAAVTFRGAIVTSPNGFDILSFVGDEFGKAPRMAELREFLLRDVADYDNIVLDMPAVLANDGDRLSAVRVSAICDAVLLVCALGKDKLADISEVFGLIKGGGSALAGLVSNEIFSPEPASASLRRFAKKFKWRAGTGERSGSPA